jgi:hypothetical protein
MLCGRTPLGLFSLGRVHRTVLSAGAAINALVGVDLVLAVTFGDGFHRTVLCAYAAGDAVVTNLVCHGHVPPFI